MKRSLLVAMLVFGLSLAGSAHAWWNTDWVHRQKIVLDTAATGADIKENLANVTVPVRLHTGNFVFADAKPDGSDLRFVGGDDKAPLKHHIERWDGINEIAILWVQVPKLTGGTAAENIWLYFGNQKVVAGEDAKGSFDATYNAVFHFGEAAGVRDATANAVPVAKPAAVEAAGLIGGSGRFAKEAMRIAEHPALKRAAGSTMTVSAWIKPADVAARAVIYQQGAVTLGLEGGKLTGLSLAGGTLQPAVWQHATLTVGNGKATLYLNGVEVASGAASLPEVSGEAVVGEGMQGEIDELQLSGALRTPDWVKAAALGQGLGDKLVKVATEGESAESGGHSYFGILIDNLTVDAWVVIVILGIMLVIAVYVMWVKAVQVGRIDKGNQAFMTEFRELVDDLTPLNKDENAARFAHSSLFNLYRIGIKELDHRMLHYKNKGMPLSLTPQAVDAIRASIDAGSVRESHKLNSKMVLLTIAISGGPFLGLLGTVVGVMITFAAIAAAGDVNVNSIAPGIAAALLATVAGLAVAIPALFGYNYLGSRVKNISADMQIFNDEFITKLAEVYTE